MVGALLSCLSWPTAAEAEVYTYLGLRNGTTWMIDQGCNCPDAYVKYNAYLNMDTTNHVIRPYGSVDNQNPRYVASEMRLFKNGYGVTYQQWSGTNYIGPIYTATYPCGGSNAGFRSYNTWTANHAYDYNWTGTFYSDLVYGC
jgi:hypothetical protein